MKESIPSIPYARVFWLTALFIGIIYSNTIDASWHLDDFPNIIHNPSVHVTSLDGHTIQSAFYAAPTSPGLYRPVGYVTFAANWYFGKTRVFGYHLVNISIHVLSAFFLFLVILKLFATPAMRTYAQEDAFFIALMASIFWAIHPIQTQAVTYIVQRLASLSALFYIMALWAYVCGRLHTKSFIRLIWYILCLACYILAVMTKENTVLLPIILVIIEFIFFQDLNKKKIGIFFWLFIGISAGLVFLIAVFLFMAGDPAGLLHKYQIRPYGLFERLFTQFRVVLFYLYQIIYPIPDQFSITHDISLSTGLFSPWSTFFSVVIIACLVFAAFWMANKMPVLSFSVLFFFINHLVESTFLPLELIFEHRNYLPSMFLFLPLSIGINRVLNYYQPQKPMYYFIFFSVSAVMVCVGLSTFIRNSDWRSEKTLWQDAMQKAPKSARPYHNLAWGYYAPAGKIKEAIEHYCRALQGYDESKGFQGVIYYNLAVIYYTHIKDYQKAIEYAQKALDLLSGYDRAKIIQARAYAAQGNVLKSLNIMDALVNSSTDDATLHFYGLLLLRQSHPLRALEIFRRCLKHSPDNCEYLKSIAQTLALLHHDPQAYWFFRRAHRICPHQADILLYLADNRLQCNDAAGAEKYISQLIQMLTISELESYQNAQIENPLAPQISDSNILPFVFRHINCLN